MNNTIYAETIFRLFVINCMPSNKAGPSLYYFVVTAKKYVSEQTHVKMLAGKHDYVQGSDWSSAHGIDVRY